MVPSVGDGSAWQARVESDHDPSEVGEVAIIEDVAEDVLQKCVVVSTGLLDYRTAVPGDRRVGRAGVVGVGLPLDESGVLHAVK
jgi:hypothetical protein